MTVSPGTKWKMGLALLVAVATVAGCSTETPPPAGVPDEHLALYEMIHEYRQDHEDALEMIVAGDDVAGRNLLAAATDRLAVAAEVCSKTPGCDMGLFAEAATRVLDALDPGMRAEPPSTYLHASALQRGFIDFRSLEGTARKLRFLRELLFPPAAYMRSKYADVRPDWLPWLYAQRAFNGLSKRLRVWRAL